MLVARDIHKSFGPLSILKGVSLEVKKGELISIVGASGAGKSTLLHIIGTLDKPDSGEIEINGMRTDALTANQMSAFRNDHIGFIFQFHHLLPEFTALENVCIPAFIKKTSQQAARKRAYDLLELLGVAHRSGHKPAELSGGEQQRVAVARALMNSPSLILADEPSGNLDSENAAALHQLFLDLKKELNQTFIVVTHNEELAALADRSIHMKDGLIS